MTAVAYLVGYSTGDRPFGNTPIGEVLVFTGVGGFVAVAPLAAATATLATTTIAAVAPFAAATATLATTTMAAAIAIAARFPRPSIVDMRVEVSPSFFWQLAPQRPVC